MADRHLVYKQCLKEVADQLGMSVTFMAKPFTDATGSGCHIHMSIFDKHGKNAFVGEDSLGPVKCSPLFKHFLAGWMKVGAGGKRKHSVESEQQSMDKRQGRRALCWGS